MFFKVLSSFRTLRPFCWVEFPCSSWKYHWDSLCRRVESEHGRLHPCSKASIPINSSLVLKIYTLQAQCVDYSLLFASHNRFYNWRFEKMLSIGSSIINLNKLTPEYTKWIHQLYWAHRHLWDCSRLLRVVILCEEWQDQILS